MKSIFLETRIVNLELGTETTTSVQKTIDAAIQFGFSCRIYGHKDNQSGKRIKHWRIKH